MRTPRTTATLLTLLATGAVVATTVSGATADPPGNNGTIKIDAQPYDDAPNNEPHVGCTFEIDFYNYDFGDNYADVHISVHPPTGSAAEIFTSSVFIGEDAAGGGTDLDASLEVNLDGRFGGYTPHPQQGFHVKATVNADGSKGADKKSKTFWVEGCSTDGGSS